MAKAKAKEAGNEKMDVDNITAVADNGDLLLPFPPFERSNHRAAQ
jgi:hypothetical protein